MTRRRVAAKDKISYKQTDISQYFKVKGKLVANASCTITDKENSRQQSVERSSERETEASTQESDSEPMIPQHKPARPIPSESECEEETQVRTPNTVLQECVLPFSLPTYDDAEESDSTYCSGLLASPPKDSSSPVKRIQQSPRFTPPSNSKHKIQSSSDDEDHCESTPKKRFKKIERHCKTSPITKKSGFGTLESTREKSRKRQLFQTDAESEEKGITSSSSTRSIPIREEVSGVLTNLPSTSKSVYSSKTEQTTTAMQKSKSLEHINGYTSKSSVNKEFISTDFTSGSIVQALAPNSKSVSAKDVNDLVTPRKITVVSDIRISNTFPNTPKASAKLCTSAVSKGPSTSTKNLKNETIKKTPSLSKNSSSVRNTKEEEWCPYALRIVKRVIKFVCSHEHLKTMLTGQESDTLNRFFKMPDEKYMSFCIKLFINMQDWSNIFYLLDKFHMTMSGPEVKKMYSYLHSNQFISTDFSSEPLEHILKCLHPSSVKNICEKLKITLPSCDKITTTDMIGKLMMFCNNPSKLNTLNPEQIMLRDAIKEAMGLCVKLHPNFYSILYKVHMLYIVMIDIQSIKDLYYLMTKVEKKDEFLPKYPIDTNFQLFSSMDEFSRFVKAYECKQTAQEDCASRNISRIFHLCTIAATQLKEHLEKNQEVIPTYLKRFTAGNKYAETLSLGIPTIAKQHPNEAQEWLMLLLNQKQFCQEMRGEWYEHLVSVQYYYLKAYNNAIITLIEALKRNDLLDVDIYALKNRARAIKENKIYKISKLQRDTISCVEPKCIEEFRVVEITNQDFYSKRVASSIHDEALNYYQKSFKNWLHCESGLLTTIFFILFWDIIYESSVPAAFVSEIQSIPLDFMTKDFYTNREEAINRRLEEIRRLWPTAQLDIFVCDIWEKHAHEKSFVKDEIVDNPKQLCDIICCIGRLKLATILERLAKDFSTYQSGIPDLFLWNTKPHKKCKFVQVKGKKGQLSPKHTLWLDFLRSVGADIEVCVVQTRISKSTKCEARTKKEEKKCLLGSKLVKSFLR